MPDNAWPLVALYCLVQCVRAEATADGTAHSPLATSSDQ